MEKTLEEKAASYLKGIIRNDVANCRKVNPCDVSDVDVELIYENDSLPGYKLHQEHVKGTVNNKEAHVIVAAIIDRKTGYWYYSQVIK